jgi:hypothetical protein
MATLSKPLRSLLEKTVVEARGRSEAGAKAALEALAVPHREPFGHLSPEERELRNRLRAHARQLGDHRHAKTGEHDIHHLVAECAYEHWHHMLFARCLAENHLLMHPEGVAVTLEECAELAPEEGAANAWELAGRYAARMLPQIFRPDNPVLHLALAPEHQQELERLLAALPTEVFTVEDSLGWVYQFWQSKRKEEINKSEVKIGADELPAVTQLFTEPYMVQFLLHNSLGAWWAGRHLRADDFKNADSEAELRDKGALPGIAWEYLRFVKQNDGIWRPAAGVFDGWPQTAKEMKILDPCCGSGHFLVEAFRIMAAFRMQEEGLSAREAGDAVLRDNLFGLEIDERCTQIAAFALALAAWTFPGAGSYRELPPLSIACSGLAVGARKEEWLKLVGADDRLQNGLERLYDLFKDAPTLGSLINPKQGLAGDMFQAQWAELQPLVTTALEREEIKKDCVAIEVGIAAQGMAKAAHMLAGKYHLVATNVPYLARSRQGNKLREFCGCQNPVAKNDIATVFLDRCLEFCVPSGTCSIVLPQNWLFQATYTNFREKVLRANTWHMIVRLGPGAFETISGEVVKAILLCISWEKGKGDHLISALDVSALRTASEKAKMLLMDDVQRVKQDRQLSNPKSTFILEHQEHDDRLSTYADCYLGICTGDFLRFGRCFWEINTVNKNWVFQRATVDKTMHWGGMTNSLLWEKGKGSLFDFVEKRLGVGNSGTWLRGKSAWGKNGIAIKQMGDLPVTIYSGEFYNNNVAVLIPKKDEYLMPIWAFCSSDEFNKQVRVINQGLAVDTQYFLAASFDIKKWEEVSDKKYPQGLPQPYSNDPTQWIFHGHPARSEQPLQVAVARLLGYRWPAELDPKMELSDEARAWVQKSTELLPLADDDGIVCLPPVRGERPAAERLLELLATAYGPEWSAARLAGLQAAGGYAGKTLEDWLRHGFFKEHCQLFHQRPFIWHIWDGRKDGFAALVNYHKLDRKNLETLTYTYLGDWLQRQVDGEKRQEDGAEERRAAAEALQDRLKRILEGEKPYDIFIRWKPLEQQPIGWEPDLNDGVRLNIRPFMTADILRHRPKINWNKDRGKDVASAPWYNLFKGERINDHHLSLAEKAASREALKPPVISA